MLRRVKVGAVAGFPAGRAWLRLPIAKRWLVARDRRGWYQTAQALLNPSSETRSLRAGSDGFALLAAKAVLHLSGRSTRLAGSSCSGGIATLEPGSAPRV